MHRFTSFLVLLLLVGTFGVCTPGLAQDPSAQMDLNSTTKGLLPPRMTTTQRDAINSPAEGLVVYNTTDKNLNVYTGSQWVAAGASSNNAPVPGAVYDAEGLPYLPVRSRVTGRIWLDRNLGATRVAQARQDYPAYGDLYQWGRQADGHQNYLVQRHRRHRGGLYHHPSRYPQPRPLHWRPSQRLAGQWRRQPVVGRICREQPLPPEYRLPTETELSDEVLGWASQDNLGAFDSALKLPMAGYRIYTSSSNLDGEGYYGYYWTSSTSGGFARLLRTAASSANMASTNRARGACVRCIKD